MPVSKQDIGLIFGVQGGGKISGESGSLIKSQIDSIIKSLNSKSEINKRGLAVKLDVSGTKTQFSNGIRDVLTTINSQKNFSLKVSKIDATSAINALKTQLNSVLKTIKVDTGFTVSVGTNGATSAVKQISGDAKEAALSLSSVEAKLKEINLTNQSISSNYKNVKSALGGESATGDNLKDVESLKSAYIELQRITTELDINKTNATQDDVNQIYKTQSAVQSLMATIRQKMVADSEAAIEAKKRADAETASANSQKQALLSVIELEGRLKEITSTNSTISKQYNEANKILSNENTVDSINEVEILKQKYIELESLTANIRANKSQSTQEEINQIYSVQSSMQELIATTMNRVSAERAVSEELKKTAANEKAILDMQIKQKNSDIGKQYVSTEKILVKDTTDTGVQELEALKQKYIELQTLMAQYKVSKSQTSQEEIAKIYETQNAVQSLIKTTMDRVNAENLAASAAKEASDKAAAAADLQVRKAQELEKAKTDAIALQKKMSSAITGFTSASNTGWYQSIVAGKQEVDDMINGVRSLDSESVDRLTKSFNANEAEIRNAGLANKSFGDTIVANAKKFTSWLGISQVVMRLVATLRDMVTTVKDIDSAMTELRKVTEETEIVYTRFLETSGVRARELGASITDTVNATADFARLGYDLDEASNLADAALIYKNVGDGIEDVSTASESIISTIKAFGVEAENAMMIVDKFNEVGKMIAQ